MLTRRRKKTRRKKQLGAGWLYLLAGVVFAVAYFQYPDLLPPPGDLLLKRKPAATLPINRPRVGGSPADSLEQSEFAGRVISITDGDTVTVLDDQNRQHKIRLAGIDAPERGQSFWKAAKQTLSELCFQQSVQVNVKETDRYGRSIGWIMVDGRNVNQKLVQLGLAWHYTQYDDGVELAALESDARLNRRGLWASPHPIPPWEWRRGRR